MDKYFIVFSINGYCYDGNYTENGVLDLINHLQHLINAKYAGCTKKNTSFISVVCL